MERQVTCLAFCIGESGAHPQAACQAARRGPGEEGGRQTLPLTDGVSYAAGRARWVMRPSAANYPRVCPAASGSSEAEWLTEQSLAK